MSIWGRSRRAERRRTPRYEPRDLVAYYWTGAIPRPRKVSDIGLQGARISAPETFYPGTLIQIVFVDRGESPEGEANDAPNICVYGQVLGGRAGGLSVEFTLEPGQERRRLRRFLNDLRARDEERAARIAESESVHELTEESEEGESGA